MKGTYIGEFEELVMLTIASLANQTYAVVLKEALEAVSSRKINISAVHAALYRLQDKRFLTSFFGEATKVRGGKKKRYFKVTAAGFATLDESRSIRLKLWDKIPQLMLEKK